MSKPKYEEAVSALFTQLPMFQREGPAAYKADLSATKQVCTAIGNPEQRLKFVHVAGTNGKGTVCHMVAAVLQHVREHECACSARYLSLRSGSLSLSISAHASHFDTSYL